MFIFYIFLGIFAGFGGGILGVGAGVFLMPSLLILGHPYPEAVYGSLLVVFVSSLTSAIQIVMTQKLYWKPITIMEISASLAAILGSLVLINIIPVSVLIIFFAGVMFVNVDFLGLMHKRTTQKSKIKLKETSFFLPYVFIGALAGSGASLLGIGGGIFVVTLLVIFCRYDIKDAVRTSIIIMTISSFVSLLAAFASGQKLPFGIGITISLGAVASSFVGVKLLRYINPETIRRCNYFISLLLGVTMLLQI